MNPCDWGIHLSHVVILALALAVGWRSWLTASEVQLIKRLLDERLTELDGLERRVSRLEGGGAHEPPVTS